MNKWCVHVDPIGGMGEIGGQMGWVGRGGSEQSIIQRQLHFAPMKPPTLPCNPPHVAPTSTIPVNHTSYNTQLLHAVFPRCHYSPCQNGGSCVDYPNGEDYDCLCSDGFSGKDCELTGKRYQHTLEYSLIFLIMPRIYHHIGILLRIHPKDEQLNTEEMYNLLGGSYWKLYSI